MVNCVANAIPLDYKTKSNC